jgi:hypothetical protein
MVNTDARGMLKLLQSVVPPNTAVTVSSEINVLESLGIVSNERSVTAMRTASLLVPPDTPVTFRGLMNTLAQLMKMNPGIKESHAKVIDESLAMSAQMDDFQLTFGTFLPICQKLLEGKSRSGEGV